MNNVWKRYGVVCLSCILLVSAILYSISYDAVRAAGKSVGLSGKKWKLAVGDTGTVQLVNRGKWKIIKAVSSKKSVAKIKKVTGSRVKICAVKKGTAKITVKIKNSATRKTKKLSCTVTVRAKKDELSTPLPDSTTKPTLEPTIIPGSTGEPAVIPEATVQPTQEPVKSDFETADTGVQNIVCGWNAGNALDSESQDFSGTVEQWETLWGSPVITKELIHEIGNAGFNAVRIPVTWDGHMDSADNVDSAWMNRVKEIVDYCMEEDLYAIINVHHDCGGSKTKWLRADLTDYDAISTRFQRLWKQIAGRFKDYGEKLLFEGYNELLDGEANWTSTDAAGYEAQNRLAQLFVDTVRETGGNNRMRNLIVEVHCYMPDSFTTDAEWLSVNDTEFKDEMKQELDQTFACLDKYFIRKGIPVIVGEYGAQDKGNEKERARYAYYFAYHAKQYGIAAFWWDDSGNMAIIDRKSRAWSYPEIRDAIIAGATLRDTA